MSGTETQWTRVSRNTPCPVCGKTDWCLIASDESAAICPRIESAKRAGDAGYFHRLVETPRLYEPRRVLISNQKPLPDLTPLARQYQHAANVDRLHAFAASLDVKAESLAEFGVGWSVDHAAWTFPMRDPQTEKVTGIRLRRPDGAKFSVKDGKESLFLSDTMTNNDPVLIIAEGASDAIASHSIGFQNAVGRPSCTGGTQHLVALVRMRKPASAVIVSDNDEPGIRGANSLAGTLSLYCRETRVITPPTNFKDLRQWVAAGATRADVDQLFEAASVVRPNIKITTRGKK